NRLCGVLNSWLTLFVLNNNIQVAQHFIDQMSRSIPLNAFQLINNIGVCVKQPGEILFILFNLPKCKMKTFGFKVLIERHLTLQVQCKRKSTGIHTFNSPRIDETRCIGMNIDNPVAHLKLWRQNEVREVYHKSNSIFNSNIMLGKFNN